MTAALAAAWRRPTATSPGPTPRLVFLHGFTQTRRSWDYIADRVGDRFEVVLVDAPGHGGSGGVVADLPTAASALGRLTGPATYVGYSMGGRLALHLAVVQPSLVDRLVLISSTAGIDDDHERADRRTADEARAASIERDGVVAFLDRWLAQPLFAGLSTDAAGLDERRANTAAGLASSLRLAGAGAQDSLWGRLTELPMPVLLVAGERDHKFVAIAERMAAAIPMSSLVIVPGAGHVVHLERPDEFVAALGRWLDEQNGDAHPSG